MAGGANHDDAAPRAETAVYDGPYIAVAGGNPAFRWVWVANGTRALDEVFAAPQPLVSHVLDPWDLLPSDPAEVDALIESFRSENSGADGDVWSDDDVWGPEAPPEAAGTVERLEPGIGRGAEIGVLGPVEVIGWIEPPDRAVVTELACYLALHRGRAIGGEELRAALRPDAEREPGAKTLRTYMSLLRRALGTDLVPAGSASGYRLSAAVTVDWERFESLTALDADEHSLRDALALVRARPFAGVAPGTYGWVFSELLVSAMEVAIVSATRRLAETALARGDLDTAAWATGQGLLGVNGDFSLWELHLAVAERRGPTELARARRDAEAVLGPDAEGLIART